MIKSILAVVAAAACAGAILEIIPEAAPAVAAGVSAAAQSHGMSVSDVSDGAKPTVLDAVRVADHRKAVCARAWPYYEPACLHDGRGADGKMRVVRIIVTDHPAARHTAQTRP